MGLIIAVNVEFRQVATGADRHHGTGQHGLPLLNPLGEGSGDRFNRAFIGTSTRQVEIALYDAANVRFRRPAMLLPLILTRGLVDTPQHRTSKCDSFQAAWVRSTEFFAASPLL